jgi:outer membrane murein-binding lipoprotein Lpp
MKLFATVFSAVLLAGLVIYSIYRKDQTLDIAAREWDESSEMMAHVLERATEGARVDDTASLLALKHHLMSAGTELAQKPSRTRSKKLEIAYRFASSYAHRLESERSAWITERDSWRMRSREAEAEVQQLKLEIAKLRNDKNAAKNDDEKARVAAMIVRQSNSLEDAISRERVARIKADDLEKRIRGQD